MGQHIHAASQRIVYASVVLRMGKDRLALRVSDINRCFDCGGIHVYDRLVSHESTGEQLDAIEAHVEILPRHVLGLLWAGCLGQLHRGRKINRVAPLGKNISRHKDLWPGNLSSLNPVTKSKGVVGDGTQVPHGREAPTSQQRLQLRFGSLFPGVPLRVFPSVFEMYMTVPEACDDHLAGAVDHLCRLWNFQLAGLCHRNDSPTADQHHCVVNGICRGGGINSSTLKHQVRTIHS